MEDHRIEIARKGYKFEITHVIHKHYPFHKLHLVPPAPHILETTKISEKSKNWYNVVIVYSYFNFHNMDQATY